MNLLKSLLGWIAVICSYPFLFAQNSFVKQVDFEIQENHYYSIGIDVNQDNKLGFCGTNLGRIDLGSISAAGALEEVFSLTHPNLPIDRNVGPYYGYSYLNNFHTVAYKTYFSEEYGSSTVISTLNTENQQVWTKQLADNIIFLPRFAVNPDEELLTFRRGWPNENNDDYGFALSLLNLSSGEELWGKRYRNLTDSTVIFTPGAVIHDSDQHFYTAGTYYNNDNGAVPSAHFLGKFNTVGELVRSVELFLPGLSFRTFLTGGLLSSDQEGNIYLLGNLRTSEEINNYGVNGIYQAILMKFTPDLELMWSKIFITEEFSVSHVEIAVTFLGNSFFTLSTRGNFPVISGKLDAEGNLISYQGYDFLNPQIAATNDEILYIVGEQPSVGFNKIIAKTLPDGSIPSCVQFPACVSVQDFEVPLQPGSAWSVEDLLPMLSMEMNVSTRSISLTDYCEVQAYPEPDFTFPDTLCQYSCAQPADLKNQLANQVKWQITGPGIDTLIVDTTFQWCFTDPGLYILEHQVWALGCFASLTDSVLVLEDDLQSPLGPDTVACSFPYQLAASSSRPLTSFVWNDGSTNSTLVAPAAGTYRVTASDGYCQVEDTISIIGIEEVYPPPVIQVTTDTIVCESEFPFTLKPQSPYTTSFLLNDQPFADSIDTQSGNYVLQLVLDGCEFEETIRLAARDCSASIYLPNVFSPNNDGINDRIYPQGVNFVTVQLQVFDRWGGLIYSVSEPDSSWNGTREGKAVNNGTYLVVLRYRNVHSGKEEIITQGVRMLR